MTRDELLAKFDKEIAPQMLERSMRSMSEALLDGGYPTEEEMASARAWWKPHAIADVAKVRAQVERILLNPDAPSHEIH